MHHFDRTDGIYHEDILGFKAVKKFFWDKGIIDNTHVYFRRRNVDGEYIWLVASVANIVDNPVPGFILKESCVDNEEQASKLNRLIRITALLAKAVEDAYSYHDFENSTKDTAPNNSHNNDTSSSISLDMENDLKLLQTLLAQQGESSTDLLQNLIPRGASSGDSNSGCGSDGEDANLESPSVGPAIKRNSFESKSSFLEMISLQPSIDMSKIKLKPQEVKLLALVMSGQLSVNQLAEIIFDPKSQVIEAGQILEKLMIPMKHKAHNNNSDRPNRRSSHNFTGRNRVASSNSYPSLLRRHAKDNMIVPIQKSQINQELAIAPHLVSLNLSFSGIGNAGMAILSESLYFNTPELKCLDISFCQVHEKGFLSLSRALVKRRKKGMRSLQGLILNGNIINYRSAKDLGLALCRKPNQFKSYLRHQIPKEGGYTEDDEEEDSFDDEDDDDSTNGQTGGLKRRHSHTSGSSYKQKHIKTETTSHDDMTIKLQDQGIKLIHLASTSLSASSLMQILGGLGKSSQLTEIDVSSNSFGAEGITPFADFLEGRGQHTMSQLDRLNISNNNIGDDGLAKITRAIAKRQLTSVLDINLSFNDIGSGGTGTLMNKLLYQNVVSLSLDNNMLGDAGCQLVAASLTSMHHLSSLNLSFNQIGSRGVTTLMRALIGCESLTFLGLSGNIMKITGAIAMGFALAQHPRISHLELFNCCLSQVAQCHIVAGIISNRWVPMRVVNGFRVGPPMAAIGALDLVGQHLGNTECLTIRRNVQMKTMLELVQLSKNKEGGTDLFQSAEPNYNDYQSLDFIAADECNNGAPSQNTFMRMLEWLNRIPFDEEELNSLRQYFYDADDGSPDGLRGSDGKINLKYRGDLLAALGSDAMKQIGKDEKKMVFPDGPAVGLSLDESNQSLNEFEGNETKTTEERENETSSRLYRADSPCSSNSRNSVTSRSSAHGSASSLQSSQSQSSKCKARITMFPKFFEKLDLLKSNAQEMMNTELDPSKQDLIAQQFAEASLLLLRQLRYQCMNSGLDGWRHGKMRRKVLVVDDSMVTRKLVSRAFEKANFIVDTAENGEEGVRMMKESVYDIAFMDIDMPVMNGFDATKALREWEDLQRPGARQPICALTATYVDDFEVHELMKFKEAGLDVMESKPCNIPRLFKVVDDVSPLFSDLTISVTKQHSSNSLKHL